MMRTGLLPYLEVPELVHDRLVQEEPDVLLVEEGLDLGHVALLRALAVAGLARMDALQDA